MSPEEYAQRDERTHRFHNLVLEQQPPEEIARNEAFWEEVFSYYREEYTPEFMRAYKAAWLGEYTKEWEEFERSPPSRLITTAHWTLRRKQGGQALRALRESRRITQDALARATGEAKNLISRVELGGTEKPSFEFVIKLWGSFGLSPVRAAQDYGMEVPRPIPVPELETVRAIIRSFDDCPELRDQLIAQLTFTAAVFEQQYSCSPV